MSLLEKVPLELFVQIISELPSDVDKQCLRLVCRAFMTLILPLPRAKRYEHFDPTFRASFSHAPPLSKYIENHLELVGRLFRPGNVFHLSGSKLCGSCLLIQPEKGFPKWDPSNRLLLDGQDICGPCIYKQFLFHNDIGRGRQLSLGDDVSIRCWVCGQIDRNHTHHLYFQKSGASDVGMGFYSPRELDLCKNPAGDGFCDGFYKCKRCIGEFSDPLRF